jgi:hypothetical protein
LAGIAQDEVLADGRGVPDALGDFPTELPGHPSGVAFHEQSIAGIEAVDPHLVHELVVATQINAAAQLLRALDVTEPVQDTVLLGADGPSVRDGGRRERQLEAEVELGLLALRRDLEQVPIQRAATMPREEEE